jgi:hypothetical protein
MGHPLKGRVSPASLPSRQRLGRAADSLAHQGADVVEGLVSDSD